VKYRLFFIFWVFVSTTQISGQEYFRIEADFTLKIKKSDGNMNLTKGKVYYDKNYKELIYAVTFPQAETWAVKDTSLCKIRNNMLTERISIPSVNEFTVFHLSLNSGLQNFGLTNSAYRVNKVEKKGDLVLSYWKLPEKAGLTLDYVIVAKKNNRLESVVWVGKESKIISRQFFRNYIRIDAFEFPGQIVQILYDTNGRENYQVTDFKNVKVNSLGNEDKYRCMLLKI
jgi:hypothetical protein